jgi:hypothetical protein
MMLWFAAQLAGDFGVHDGDGVAFRPCSHRERVWYSFAQRVGELLRGIFWFR